MLQRDSQLVEKCQRRKGVAKSQSNHKECIVCIQCKEKWLAGLATPIPYRKEESVNKKHTSSSVKTYES